MLQGHKDQQVQSSKKYFYLSQNMQATSDCVTEQGSARCS